MSKAKIYYHDIGDYHSREEKLDIIKNAKSFSGLPLKELRPNEHGDWINKRTESFGEYIPLAPEKKFILGSKSVFNANSLGAVTARDFWVYNFSLHHLKFNIKKTITHYNQQRELVNKGLQKSFIANSLLGSWSRDWQNNIKRDKTITEDTNEYRKTMYRPFVYINAYFEDDLIQERYQLPKLFPNKFYQQPVIVVTGVAASKPFTSLIVNDIPNLDFIEKSNCFPLYYYEEKEENGQADMFDGDKKDKYIRRDGVSDFILNRALSQYNLSKGSIEKEDIFYYVYGLLHSPDYREAFKNDLKKSLPRLPLVEDIRDFWAFSKAGRKLADLHLNYEEVPAYKEVEITGIDENIDPYELYTVSKIRFGKIKKEVDGKKKTTDDKSVIQYNSRIKISGIPEKAYEYVVNGRSAIEWILDRYQVKTDKKSGITNNPNDWAKEHEKPRYILDLLLSIINVSVQTVDIVAGLPKMEFEEVTEENVL